MTTLTHQSLSRFEKAKHLSIEGSYRQVSNFIEACRYNARRRALGKPASDEAMALSVGACVIHETFAQAMWRQLTRPALWSLAVTGTSHPPEPEPFTPLRIWAWRRGQHGSETSYL
jgi:hypothetical protein